MAEEREGAVTMRGNPKTLIGPEVKVGQAAPRAEVVGQDLSTVSLGDSGGQVQILLAIPSVDTPVCAIETKKFNDAAAQLPSNISVKVVSCDLPFAQKRWCASEGVERVQALSDHRNTDFGNKYGVLVKDLRILCRAAFVVDANNKVVYSEYVPEIADEPRYDEILAAARAAAG